MENSSQTESQSPYSFVNYIWKIEIIVTKGMKEGVEIVK
jgi:hypothetical protein